MYTVSQQLVQTQLVVLNGIELVLGKRFGNI